MMLNKISKLTNQPWFMERTQHAEEKKNLYRKRLEDSIYVLVKALLWFLHIDGFCFIKPSSSLNYQLSLSPCFIYFHSDWK